MESGHVHVCELCYVGCVYVWTHKVGKLIFFLISDIFSYLNTKPRQLLVGGSVVKETSCFYLSFSKQMGDNFRKITEFMSTERDQTLL